MSLSTMLHLTCYKQ